MIRSKGEKRRRLSEIMDRLEVLYPNAECALEYGGDPWRLLVMGRLSAQCTDARVNVVCRELFSRYPTAEAMACADIAELERIVKPCGLYRMKAGNIKAASEMIVKDFGGSLPSDMEGLLSLPGVGRKIANLILGDVFSEGAIVCDTHCIRICGRLGMYPESLRDPTKIEFILRDLCDISRGSDFCHRIVIFGREICTARSPACEACPLADICEHRIKASMKRSATNGER
ncbi:MAG: endonuclease III [Clostridia bacterium]|nr:endonuclease III [Clostridia bacterium]